MMRKEKTFIKNDFSNKEYDFKIHKLRAPNVIEKHSPLATTDVRTRTFSIARKLRIINCQQVRNKSELSTNISALNDHDWNRVSHFRISEFIMNFK